MLVVSAFYQKQVLYYYNLINTHLILITNYGQYIYVYDTKCIVIMHDLLNIWSDKHAKFSINNDRLYRILNDGLGLSQLSYCQTKSENQHRFTNYQLKQFVSDK